MRAWLIAPPLVAALVAVCWWLQRRAHARESARLAIVIKPLCADHYRFTGHDDSLRVQSDQRRDDAAKKRREAAQIVSGTPIEEPRIRLVGRL